MRHVQAIRGGTVDECLDWLARYVDAGARHLILRIGSLTGRPESVAEQLLPALRRLDPDDGDT
jgi:alkanesulfonate monooxygenase SsuD/methylene tetrahydromethanopterin reductase-like flavin-dependent oxidoreductase (luciferase family)